MQAGKLRHRVQLQEHTTAFNASGDVVETWATVATLWAAVEPLQGRELFTAQAIDARLTHRVTLRYRDDVTASQRILFDSRILHLLGPPINPEERNRTLQFLCMENA